MKKYYLTFLGTMLVTRFITLTKYGIYQENVKVLSRTYNDNFHHYQLGMVLVVLYLLAKRKFSKATYLLAVGLGLIVEEYSVILYQLGIPHFHYLTVTENIIFVFLCLFVGIFCYKYN